MPATPQVSSGVLRRLREEYVDEHSPAMTVALVVALGAHSPVSRDYVDLRWDFLEHPAHVSDPAGTRLVPTPLHADFHGAHLEAMPTSTGYAFRVHTARGPVPFHDLAGLGEALRDGSGGPAGDPVLPRPRLSTM